MRLSTELDQKTKFRVARCQRAPGVCGAIDTLSGRTLTSILAELSLYCSKTRLKCQEIKLFGNEANNYIIINTITLERTQTNPIQSH